MRRPERLTRRRLLKLAGGATVFALSEHKRWPHARAVSAAERSRWTFDIPVSGQGTVETEVIDPGHPYTAVVAAWQGVAPSATAADAVSVEIMTSTDGQSWSDWIVLDRDHHAPVKEDGWRHHGPLLGPGSLIRMRLTAPDDVVVSAARVTMVDTASQRTLAAAPGDLIDGLIIPRASWGADESYRFVNQDADQGVVWPPSYAPVWKIVVHHTDTQFGWDDPAAIVRAVYYYHAIILGWGDIGYNYLVDYLGNVYEGRYGGENVIGGHALEFNTGSMGISLVGNYETVEPTTEALDGLAKTIAIRAPQVDVTSATDWLTWANVPNLCGHGDVLDTACPGSLLYAKLPLVRGWVAGTGPIELPPPIKLEDPTILQFSVWPDVVDPGDVVEVRAVITNEGRDPLPTQGPDPGFIYDEGQNFASAGYPKVEGCYRLCVAVSGEGETPRPYRWGFGSPLAHGEKREILGYIRMESFGPKTFSASVIKEFVRYFDQDRGTQTIYAVHPLVSRAAPSTDPSQTYFDVTGHNVGPSFYGYWQSHGGLHRFGYPLTELFEEQSQVDGNTYLVQYFERGRFEWHPEYIGTEDEVLLGLLGLELTENRQSEAPFLPIEPFTSTDELVYFPETGHSTSYRFLNYWQTNGGAMALGYPISEKYEEVSETDGTTHLVQYFERIRLEYHPQFEDPAEQIKLGHLGREVLINRGWLPGAE